jgi:hypothetical protein
MHVEVMMVSGAAFVLLGFVLVGGPMLLVDWSRRRQQRAIELQIALTDALDQQFGAMVAPVVTNPLFGPWEIQIAVPLPLLRSAGVARILPVVDDVFSEAAVMGSPSYRIVLSASPGSLPVTPVPCSRQAKNWWAGDPMPSA